jgi:protein gp37
MPPWPLPNVWVGTSIESDDYTGRADELRRTPAAIRFLSCEPLLGPLPNLELTGINWVIVGGESGPKARPMHPDWARSLRDRCQTAGVSFFFKQWGTYRPGGDVARPAVWVDRNGHPGPVRDLVEQVAMVRVGKTAAGRLLDGRTWDEHPAAAR